MGIFQRLILVSLVFWLPALSCVAQEKHSKTYSVNASTLEEGSAFLEALELHFSDPHSLIEENSSEIVTGALKFTLQQAILSSLERNPAFLVQKLSPLEALQDVTEAQGALDTTFLASSNFSRLVEPSSSALGGTTITTEQFDFSAGVSQLLPTGGSVALSWDNFRTENDALFTTLSPAYDTGLGISLSQPLLRGTGWGSPRTLIRIARTGYDSTRFAFEAEVANQVKRVIDAYWIERASRGVLAVALRDLKLSKRLFNETSESVEVGLLAPVAASDASAQLARSKEGLITARRGVDEAGRNLRQVMGYDFVSEEEDPNGLSPVRASETAVISAVSFDEEESVRAGLAHRPELRAQKLLVKRADLAARLASNQVLPDLRIVGGAGLEGLAGTEQAVEGFPSPGNVFPGDYYDSLDRMDSGDYYNYSVGVTLSVPLENRAARADFNRRKIALNREKLLERQLVQSITAEVLSALSALEAAIKRVEAARETIKFSKESLDVANQRLKSGLGTVRETLEAQRDLSDAELRLVRALADYSSAHAEVLRTRGELLSYYQIEVESEAS